MVPNRFVIKDVDKKQVEVHHDHIKYSVYYPEINVWLIVIVTADLIYKHYCDYITDSHNVYVTKSLPNFNYDNMQQLAKNVAFYKKLFNTGDRNVYIK